MLNQPVQPVGIVGYGAYIPRYRLPGAEISRIWSGDLGVECSARQPQQRSLSGRPESSPVKEKAVPGLDEDTVTMSIEAARNALARSQVDPRRIQAVWVGSESHPYAVKPSGTIVAEAIGATPATLAADWQFACKAGTEAVQAAMGLVGSGMASYALAIGMDTAQSRPGDALEYTAGAGGAALLLGTAAESVAVIERSLSYVSDTTDFWRRPGSRYPSHAERFSGDPGYFGHVIPAAEQMMELLGAPAQAFDHVVVHQPNIKFPVRAMRALGFSRGAVGGGPAGRGDREHLCRFSRCGPDRDSGHRRTGPARADGQLRQRGRVRRIRTANQRASGGGAKASPPYLGVHTSPCPD